MTKSYGFKQIKSLNRNHIGMEALNIDADSEKQVSYCLFCYQNLDKNMKAIYRIKFAINSIVLVMFSSVSANNRDNFFHWIDADNDGKIEIYQQQKNHFWRISYGTTKNLVSSSGW